MPETSSEPKPKRLRFRYSLRMLMLVMLILCIGIGWLGILAREARRQRSVVRELDAKVKFRDQLGWIPATFDTGYLERIDSLGAPREREKAQSDNAELPNRVLELFVRLDRSTIRR